MLLYNPADRPEGAAYKFLNKKTETRQNLRKEPNRPKIAEIMNSFINDKSKLETLKVLRELTSKLVLTSSLRQN